MISLSAYHFPTFTHRTVQKSRFELSNIPLTNIGTKPHINIPCTQQFTNVQKIPQNPSNTPTYNTIPPSIILFSTVSNPTCINSSASISETIKHFDGLDQNYTP